MSILAFDTCLNAVSAAVNSDGRIVTRLEVCATGHAERLLPVIEATCRDAGIVLSDVRRVAVTLGPGGFTGLRVGISAARAFALALGVPVVGISSLELLARSVADKVTFERIAAVAPAGRAGVFVQVFARAPFATLGPPQLLDAVAAATEVAANNAVAIGPGATSFANLGVAVATAMEDAHPDAAVLAALAPALTPLADVRPLYLRAADAKPQVGKSLARVVE